MTSAPAGWYPVDGNQERFWDGTNWTDQIRAAEAAAAPAATRTTGMRDRLADATARLTAGAGELPADTLWSAVGKPITGIGAGRYRMDATYLYFERGTLRTDSQQVPIAQVIDVDVAQTMAQKARGVFTLTVQVQRGAGVERVLMEDIPDGREAQRQINDAAHAARTQIQQRANTVTYQGQHPAAAPAAPAPAAAPDPIEQLQKLGALRDAGVLTDEEFTAKKAEILSRL